MSKQIQPFFRKSIIAAATFAIVGGGLCTILARASDATMSPTKDSAEESKMASDQMDKMKKEAADSSESETMKASMAKTMVMDQMAMSLAKDAKFKQESMDLMSDPNMTKIHDEAKTMAEDPDQMKKMKKEIMADPKELKDVIRHAMMMDMMQEKMSADDKGDKTTSSMGEKMMDKMKAAK